MSISRPLVQKGVINDRAGWLYDRLCELQFDGAVRGETIAAIATYAGITRSTCERYLDKLASAGLVEIIRERISYSLSRANTYILKYGDLRPNLKWAGQVLGRRCASKRGSNVPKLRDKEEYEKDLDIDILSEQGKLLKEVCKVKGSALLEFDDVPIENIKATIRYYTVNPPDKSLAGAVVSTLRNNNGQPPRVSKRKKQPAQPTAPAPVLPTSNTQPDPNYYTDDLITVTDQSGYFLTPDHKAPPQVTSIADEAARARWEKADVLLQIEYKTDYYWMLRDNVLVDYIPKTDTYIVAVADAHLAKQLNLTYVRRIQRIISNVAGNLSFDNPATVKFIGKKDWKDQHEQLATA